MNTEHNRGHEKIKVFIELPANYLLDVDHHNLHELFNIRDYIKKEVKNQVIDKIIDQLELPNIQVDAAELKEMVISRMADRIIDSQNL